VCVVSVSLSLSLCLCPSLSVAYTYAQLGLNPTSRVRTQAGATTRSELETVVGLLGPDGDKQALDGEPCSFLADLFRGGLFYDAAPIARLFAARHFGTVSLERASHLRLSLVTNCSATIEQTRLHHGTGATQIDRSCDRAVETESCPNDGIGARGVQLGIPS